MSRTRAARLWLPFSLLLSLIGLMVESNLQEGSQQFPQPAEKLLPGVSITDACISWETTERVLREGYVALAGKL